MESSRSSALAIIQSIAISVVLFSHKGAVGTGTLAAIKSGGHGVIISQKIGARARLLHNNRRNDKVRIGEAIHVAVWSVGGKNSGNCQSDS